LVGFLSWSVGRHSYRFTHSLRPHNIYCLNGDEMFSIGMKVLVQIDNPHIGEWINGKTGIIIAPDCGFFDWVVEIEGTPRDGGLFGLNENNLASI
jgi:hypothetical protein